MTRVAVVQKAPVLLNLEATLDITRQSIKEARDQGSELVIFPETFLPGYPTWLWRLRPGGDMGIISDLHGALLSQAVDIEAGGMKAVQDAAREQGVTVVIGLNEREGKFSRSTLYNTTVIIGPDGSLLNRHRKLMPTNPERTIWGQGDASGLRVVDTPAGRIGTLMCWEAYVPLARQVMYSEGVEIFVIPTWDNGERWMATMRHIATEGGCWTISCAMGLRVADVPEDFPHRDKVFKEGEDWINVGDSVIFAPFGGPVAGPMHAEQGILTAELDLSKPASARRSLDVAGHYHRPDIFEFTVNREVRDPIVVKD